MGPHGTLMGPALECSHGTPRHPDAPTFGVQWWDPTAPQCAHLWGAATGPPRPQVPMGAQALPARGGSRDRSSGDPGGPPARPAPRPGSPVPCPTPVSPGEVAGAPCPAHQPLLAPPTSCDSSTTTASPRPPLVLPRPRPPDQPPPIDPCLTPPPATPSPCRRGRPVAEPTLGPRRVTGTPRGRRGVEGGGVPPPVGSAAGGHRGGSSGGTRVQGGPKGVPTPLPHGGPSWPWGPTRDPRGHG